MKQTQNQNISFLEKRRLDFFLSLLPKYDKTASLLYAVIYCNNLETKDVQRLDTNYEPYCVIDLITCRCLWDSRNQLPGIVRDYRNL